MQIFFLTSNLNKLKEAQEIMAGIEVLQKPISLDEIQAVDVEEVIKHKIAEAKKYLADEHFFVEDTALYLGENEELGALAKFFSNERIYKAYVGEAAEAVCAIGFSDGQIFTGYIRGKVVASRGNLNFGWDPVFQPDGHNKTFAEMTMLEKNAISMRRMALEKLRDYLTHKKHL